MKIKKSAVSEDYAHDLFIMILMDARCSVKPQPSPEQPELWSVCHTRVFIEDLNSEKILLNSIILFHLHRVREALKKTGNFMTLCRKGGYVAVSKPNFLIIRNCDIHIWRVGKRLIY